MRHPVLVDLVEHGAGIELPTNNDCGASGKGAHEPAMAAVVLKRTLDEDDGMVHIEHGVRAQNNPDLRQILPMGAACAFRKAG